MKRKATLVCLVLLALLAAPVAPAHAASYSVQKVAIDAQVASDGSMVVSEERTYDFVGDYTFAYWDIDTSAAKGIEVIGVSGPEGEYALTEDPNAASTRPPATYQVTRSGSTTEIRAFFRASNSLHPLKLTYRILGAATRWKDTSELYWQFIGADHEMVMEDVSVRIVLPEGSAGSVRAWAHGPLTGYVQPNADGTVDLTVNSLPASTFVEARVTFPSSALSAVPVVEQDRLQTILDEEAQWAREANAERTRARLLTWGLSALVIALSLAAFVWTTRYWLKNGKEYRPQFQGEYFREKPAELTPAQVSALMNMGRVSDEAVTATLMDLIDRGALHIERMQVEKSTFLGLVSRSVETYRVTRVPSAEAALSVAERLLISLMFETAGSGDAFTMEDLKEAVKTKATAIAWKEGVDAFRDQVSHDVEQLGLLEKKGRAASVGFIMLGAVVGFSGVLPLSLAQTGWALLVSAPLGAAICVLGFKMTRRSPQAAELAAQYKAVERYLKDFGRMQEKPPDSIVLWRYFLTLAVVFGIADEVIRNLQVRAPEVLRDPTMGTIVWMMTPSVSGLTPMHSLSTGMASVASVAGSHSSSAAGGGGGFSGGGGGGGGGGGSGAG